MQGAAGVGHQRRHAELGEHVRGRFHLGGSADRVPAGAVDDPLDRRGVRFGQLGRDVLTQPRFIARGLGGVQGLDHRGGHAFIEHAAQEFLAGREPGRAAENLDVRAERPPDGGLTCRPVAAGELGDAQAAPGHWGHHRDISEGNARGPGDFRQLPLDPR